MLTPLQVETITALLQQKELFLQNYTPPPIQGYASLKAAIACFELEESLLILNRLLNNPDDFHSLIVIF